MSSIDVQPLVLTDYTLAFTDSYEKAVSKVVFTPGTPIKFQGGTPSAKYSRILEWTCAVDYVQDWNTTGSFSQYLHTHEGEAVEATFAPTADDEDAPTFTATVTIIPGSIGGTVNTFGTSSVSLDSTKPVLVPAA